MSIDVCSAASEEDTASLCLQGPAYHFTAPPTQTLQLSSNAYTVSELFLRTVQQYGDRIACRIVNLEEAESPSQRESTIPSRGPERRYSVIPWKWNEYGTAATRFAKALIAHGVGPREVVTIQGANSPQWFSAHLGTILAGGVAAGVYQTNGAELCEYIVRSSGAKVAVVEDESQLKKYQGLDATALKCIVVWNKAFLPASSRVPVLSMDDFLRTGDTIPDAALRGRVSEQKPDDPCALVYTSGTTGNPKAATLTQRNLVWTVSTVVEKFSLNQDHRGISFLPLSHVAPMQLDCIVPVITGQSLYIAPPDALRGTNLKGHIVAAKPTYFLAVPRVWEKFKDAMEAKLATESFMMKHLFSICTTIGRALSSDYRYLCVKELSTPLPIYEKIRLLFESCVLHFLEMILFNKVRAALGLDQCQFAASGAGSVNREVLEFFAGLNIHILDFYGMSESSGPTTIPDDTTPVGSCGKPMPGTEIRIINPDENGEGEILIRGPNVFAGYWHDPQATSEILDGDRFLHTGDRGKFDEQGYLYVTGRIKELIKTSGGENIPPLRIEDKIKVQIPIVSQAVVLGNSKNFLTCLITLRTEIDESGSPTNKLAPDVIAALQKINSSATTLQEAAADGRVREFVMQGIQRANQLTDSHAQYVQKISVLPEDFSISNGTLTPTLKLRRAIIEQRYQRQITEMYA